MVTLHGGESARIRTFRLGMARSIPRVPNNSESLRILEQKPLGEILIDYLSWRTRYVAPRPRAVIIDPVAWSDPNWGRHHAAIRGFLEKVRRGEDLTPHLSLRPHTKGFSSAGRRGAPPADRWSDKDMLLNAKGYHHFHPNLEIGPKGFAKRASDVVIAEVSRSEFVVIGVFDHSVFQTMPDGSLTPERERFWRAADERATRGVLAGAVVLDGPGITTSCHSLPVMFQASRYARLIANVDPTLDTREFQADFFEQARMPPPAAPKWAWGLNHLDLGLAELTTGSMGIYMKGMN